MHILIIDDHTLIRDVLVEYVREHTRHFVSSASSHAEALDKIKGHGPYDCVLADLRMPDVQSASDLQSIVVANQSKPVLLFSGAATFADLYAASEVGLVGFVKKHTSAADLVSILAEMENNGGEVPESVRIQHQMEVCPTLPKTLSEEDCKILGMVAHGAHNSEIASDLGITKTRVENRLRKLYRAIGVSSRLAAANLVSTNPIR